MESYANVSGQSGIVAYQIGTDCITVQFKSGRHVLYLYSYSSAGNTAIETMKKLAQNGQGLHSYISTNCPDYVSRS